MIKIKAKLTTLISVFLIVITGVIVSDTTQGECVQYFSRSSIKITTTPWSNATEDLYYYFDCEASITDPTGDEKPIWSIKGPAFLSINQNTGEITGTPLNTDVGNNILMRIFVADNISMLFDSIDVMLTIENVNDPPLIFNKPSEIIEVIEDVQFQYDFDGGDFDPTVDELEWSFFFNEDFFSIDSVTGIMSGMPDNDDVGINPFCVNLTDNWGASDFTMFSVKVINENDPPVITTLFIENAHEGMEYQQHIEAFDIDPTNDELEWEIIETNASFIEIDQYSGILSGIPDNDDVGERWVKIQVSDGRNGMTDINYSLTIINKNEPPYILTNTLPNAIEDQEYVYTLEGIDLDPNTVFHWKINETNAEFISIDEINGTITGMPLNEHVGDWWILISISDQTGYFDVVNFTLIVENINDIPSLETLEIEELYEDQPFIIQLLGNDIDPTMDDLRWIIEETNTDFIHINEFSGLLEGIPKEKDIGNWYIIINLTDGNGGYISKNYSISVIGINDPPQLNVTSLNLKSYEDTNIILNLNDVFFDIENDPLIFSAFEVNNFTISIINGYATIIPDSNWSGIGNIEFKAEDAEYNTSINASIIIEETNDPPSIISIVSNITYIEGLNQKVTANVEDVDIIYGDELIYTWYSNNSGKIGNGISINLSLKKGKYLITLNVTDSKGGYDILDFEVEIIEKDITNDIYASSDGNKNNNIPLFIYVLIIMIIILTLSFIVVFIIFRKRTNRKIIEYNNTNNFENQNCEQGSETSQNFQPIYNESPVFPSNTEQVTSPSFPEEKIHPSHSEQVTSPSFKEEILLSNSEQVTSPSFKEDILSPYSEQVISSSIPEELTPPTISEPNPPSSFNKQDSFSTVSEQKTQTNYPDPTSPNLTSDTIFPPSPFVPRILPGNEPFPSYEDK